MTASTAINDMVSSEHTVMVCEVQGPVIMTDAVLRGLL